MKVMTEPSEAFKLLGEKMNSGSPLEPPTLTDIYGQQHVKQTTLEDNEHLAKVQVEVRVREGPGDIQSGSVRPRRTRETREQTRRWQNAFLGSTNSGIIAWHQAELYVVQQGRMKRYG